MLALLIEGVDSLRLPCSWVLLIPGAAITVFGRRRTLLVLTVFSLVAMLISWLRFAGWWFAVPHGITQVTLGVVIVAAAATAWRADTSMSDAVAAATAGLAAAWTWIPCVGPHLGDLLNGARTDPFGHLGGTIAFLTGQFLPFILLAAAGVLAPSLQDRLERRSLITLGAAMLAIVGGLFITALFDDIASELARRSTF